MQRHFLRFVPAGAKPGSVSHYFASVLLMALVILFSASSLYGQKLTASLSGTAADSSGAAVVGAQVEMINEASGDIRRAVTNGDGFFDIQAAPAGQYTVRVTAPGFTPWEVKGVVLTQGDSRTLPNISLKIGDVKEAVEVVAEGASVAPVDTGAVSTTLNQTMVDEFTLSGRDAGELMKIMPGMGTNGGLSANASFNGSDHVTGSNTGPAGNYSSNGLIPHGSMAYLLDGADLLDNNMGTQIANINPEMVSEVKMMQSSYGAEYAKGPVIFQAITKSGGKDFHGEGYFFARNSIFNAEDSYQKSIGNTITASHYYYPGGNIGGPVIIPGTKFNHNHDKLFFWFGYEYMVQDPAGSLIQYFVPTDQMKGGNFSPAYLSSLVVPSGWSQGFNVPCANPANGGCPALGGSIAGGIIPTNMFDPNGVAYLKMMPAPNETPGNTGGYNYGFNNTLPQNRWEQSEKIDYSINDNTKLTVTYTYQKEFDHHPIATWWAPNQALPYPTSMDAHTPSSVISGNFTKVFSATLVNEVVGAYGSYLNTLTPANPALVDPSKLGMTYQGLFGVKEKQFADLLSWSSGVPDFMPQASFFGSDFGGNFGAHKYDPSIADNLSKIWGTHTLKFGFYWDTMGNKQSTTGYEGQYEVETYGGSTTGNTIADLLLGHAQSYQQTNTLIAPAFQSVQHSLYAQDSWKVNRRLTVNYGLRLDHIGQWYNPTGNGVIVWDPSAYSSSNTPDTGIVWHKKDPSIPQSGWASKLYYPAPRVSAAYDLFGNAKTVLRGGLAEFYFTQGAIDNFDAASGGQFTWATPQALTSFAQINSYPGVPTAGSPLNGTTITADDLNDNKMPHTWDYNFTISQAFPFRSLLEVAYVGNRSRDMLWGGTSNNKLNDANIIPMGAFFTPDPKTGVIPCTRGVTCIGSLNANDYFAYPNYQDIYVMSHGSYSNYNSAQVSWIRSVKPVVVSANYVFGKVLGTYDGISGNGADNSGTVDGFALSKNYGPMAYDHTHIFNLAYSLDLPKFVHGNKVLGEVINGWTLSGWTGIQSGTPLETNAAGFNTQWPSGVSNSSYLGTNAVNLMPNLICDPRKNLASGQYFNPACFAPPAPGTQGTEIWPFIHGPAVINSDMSLFKSFQFSESRKLQFRLQAYNFMNHPNAAFAQVNNGDLTLNFNNNGTLSQTPIYNSGTPTNGSPAHTFGNRLIELAVKFYF